MTRAMLIAVAASSIAVGAAAQQADEIMIGPWDVSITKSALDGAVTVLAMTQSTNMVRTDLGTPDRATLGFQCSTEGTFHLIVLWPRVVTGRKDVPVRYRAGDRPVASDTFFVGTNGRTMGPTGGSHAIAGQLRSQKEFVIQAGSLEAVFNTTDTDKLLDRMADECRIPALK